ncbi:hypothetical protein HOK51_05380 [Candidatus Woesearchaeota archaeon]|jgi:hypothetical protein|nr:hypothetical protein [Candidatus Woesearchaeota archaeon]MBT6519259.1 hypothetical protein [Candidatus Woesearchaeota archaeon]MBT7368451.1 hypothetical protein [Candidatus Woesearchaeota archaeon]
MAKKEKTIMKISRYVKYVATGLLSLFSVLIFLFSLFSGAEKYGGGFKGILMNIPNALPWLVLMGLIYVAWKWELIGGFIIVLFGIFSMIFFDFFNSNSMGGFFVIALPLILIGCCFIFRWYVGKYKS